jgi:hypothetical protein
MTTIKQLIQETEELLEAKKLTIEVLHKSEDNPVFVQTRNEIIKLGVKLETLKLCQTIAERKLKEEIEFLEDSDWYGANACSLIFVKRQKRLLKLIKQLNPAQPQAVKDV